MRHPWPATRACLKITQFSRLLRLTMGKYSGRALPLALAFVRLRLVDAVDTLKNVSKMN